jgi:DNA-binding transcriptional MerR regulator
MTADDLARAAGTLTSTVRMYQAKGILPPPRRAGRAAFYGAAHLERLALIERLQAQGFSLASIKQLVDASAQGTALPEILGLRQSGASHAPEPLVLSPMALMERLPGVELSPEILRLAVEVGVIELRPDGQIGVPDPRFLHVGPQLVAEGIPAETVLHEWQHLRSLADQAAERFAAVFEQYLWPKLAAEKADPAALLSEGTAAYDRLAPLAHIVMSAALDAALRATVDRFAASVTLEKLVGDGTVTKPSAAKAPVAKGKPRITPKGSVADLVSELRR